MTQPSPHQLGPYLLHHHTELAFGAEYRLDPREPLDTGEDLSRANEHLAWVEAIGVIKEETLKGREQRKMHLSRKENVLALQEDPTRHGLPEAP